jgi:hypothetical protein
MQVPQTLLQIRHLSVDSLHGQENSSWAYNWSIYLLLDSPLSTQQLGKPLSSTMAITRKEAERNDIGFSLSLFALKCIGGFQIADLLTLTFIFFSTSCPEDFKL